MGLTLPGPSFIEQLKAQQAAKHNKTMLTRKRLSSFRTTVSHEQFVTGILLISAKVELVSSMKFFLNFFLGGGQAEQNDFLPYSTRPCLPLGYDQSNCVIACSGSCWLQPLYTVLCYQSI